MNTVSIFPEIDAGVAPVSHDMERRINNNAWAGWFRAYMDGLPPTQTFAERLDTVLDERDEESLARGMEPEEFIGRALGARLAIKGAEHFDDYPAFELDEDEVQRLRLSVPLGANDAEQDMNRAKEDADMPALEETPFEDLLRSAISESLAGTKELNTPEEFIGYAIGVRNYRFLHQRSGERSAT